jgi:preprotein translocase subunit SecF
MLAIVVSIVSLAIKGGPKYGLDFRGGTLMYATDNNLAGQPFCTACNNQLRRYFGTDYG